MSMVTAYNHLFAENNWKVPVQESKTKQADDPTSKFHALTVQVKGLKRRYRLVVMFLIIVVRLLEIYQKVGGYLILVIR